ncbi:DEAD/DEAH box helicase, partial [Candidatus Berkelbacteria bacterium]|nr:DEAD/DEAH box helicase [Candidatus Berkelbacteria bacterium]
MYNNIKSRNSNFRGGRGFGGRSRRSNRSNINPLKYVNKSVEQIDQINEPITHTFNDFKLDVRISDRIRMKGYITPTVIQDKSIPVIISGKDVIGIADTGTGKTAAFLLPLIHKTINDRSQKTLIIVPTRELAVQIEDELRDFSAGMQIFSALILGGAGYGPQFNALRRNPQFVIGTPGRLKDHLKRNTLRLNNFTNLVLDEADRMVEMGFISDVRELVSHMPRVRQSLFFSATITPEVNQLFASFTQEPVTVSVKSRETSQNVDQDVVHFTDPFHRLT